MQFLRSGPRLSIFAIVTNLVVIATCYAWLGWNTAGAGSAARNTARFASAFFVLGFAAPGLRRWTPEISEGDWLKAFVAAQMVHFAAVSVLHLEFLKDFDAAPFLQVAAFVTFGFLLVVSVGVLAESRRGAAGIGRAIAVHLVFLIYAIDYLKHPIHSLRIMGVVYLAALVLRYLPVRPAAKAASGAAGGLA